jgi:hypothetical protein
MEPMLTRCGYRCDLCLAFKPNVEKNPANRKKLSDGWRKYFGFRISEEKICCEGCLAENPMLIDAKCPVRPCVLQKGLDNCAQCGRYICGKLRQRIVRIEDIRKKTGAEIPDEEYRSFIRPYENYLRLEELRRSSTTR